MGFHYETERLPKLATAARDVAPPCKLAKRHFPCGATPLQTDGPVPRPTTMTESPQSSDAVVRVRVAQENDGARLDAALRQMSPGISLQKARALCELGCVAVSGIRAAAPQRLRSGDLVSFAPERFELSLAIGAAVVCDRGGVIVLHKMPGDAVHAGPLVNDPIAARLQRALPGAGLCQRLDRPASGMLLCGRDADSVAAISQAMERGEIEREYLGVTHGLIERDEGTIDAPLRITDEPRGDRPKVVVDHENGQNAVTHLAVIARSKTHTLVRLRLETGRTHQIRAHLRAIGHPLLGDPRYGDAESNANAHRTHGIDRTLLHSARLSLTAPATGERVEVTAVHEPDFARLFPSLRER